MLGQIIDSEVRRGLREAEERESARREKDRGNGRGVVGERRERRSDEGKGRRGRDVRGKERRDQEVEKIIVGERGERERGSEWRGVAGAVRERGRERRERRVKSSHDTTPTFLTLRLY